MALEFDSNILEHYKISQVHHDSRSIINSVDIDDTQQYLATVSDNSTVNIYNTSTSQPIQRVYCKRLGCDIVRFVHSYHSQKQSNSQSQSNNNSTVSDVLITQNNVIRYLSLYDTSYLHTYRGHTGRICSLSVSPLDDIFCSTSYDNTLRVYDMNNSNICIGKLTLPSTTLRSACTYDDLSMIVAVACDRNAIKLYDKRTMSTGCFNSFTVPTPIRKHTRSSSHMNTADAYEWTSISISPDGRHCLATAYYQSAYKYAFLLDSFTGEQKRVWNIPAYAPTASSTPSFTATRTFPTQQQQPRQQSLPSFSASFTPHSQIVSIGGDDGVIRHYDVHTGELIHSTSGLHRSVTHVRYSMNQHCMVAAVENDLVFMTTNMNAMK
jgi:WD40 repeat protein